MLKYYHILCFFFITTTVMGQKRMEMIISGNNIERLIIDGTHFSEINIRSENTQDIKMMATVYGETFENVLLKTSQEANAFLIAAGYTPFFKAYDDKLAAHKVMSLQLTITIPENRYIDIEAALSDISLQGSFDTVTAMLLSGNCTLIDFEGNGTLINKKGNIKGTITSTVFVINSSKKQDSNSIVNNSKPYILTVASKGGEISILQTE